MTSQPGAEPWDVVVIGAGVVGCAIARELSGYQLRVALVEAASDVGTGTSKANTSLLHTGFDAVPGSLEARLVRRGYERLLAYTDAAGIPLERTGALVVAWDDTQAQKLSLVEERAAANGCGDTKRLSRSELYELEPHLGPGAVAGLAVPGESIICTFTTTLAFAYQAIENGVALFLDSEVVDAGRAPSGHHALDLSTGVRLLARWVVNAAGLYADVVDRLFGHDRFRVSPRRGELIVFDKFARSLVGHILLPVPAQRSKGVLVAPTTLGNVLLGPTAEDVDDKRATESTPAGIELLLERGKRILPALVHEEVTAVYAGLRAATDTSDYFIESESDQRYICVAGIRSTGLTSSMAIAELIVALLARAGLRPVQRGGQRPMRMPRLGESSVRPYRDPDAIRSNPDYGRLVCHCERVSLGEIEDALHAPVPARTIDGLRRRTRAQLGRCQGFYCSAALTALIARVGGVAASNGSPARVER
jgi:glycerol-3-phosphate dehydrogenase